MGSRLSANPVCRNGYGGVHVVTGSCERTRGALVQNTDFFVRVDRRLRDASERIEHDPVVGPERKPGPSRPELRTRLQTNARQRLLIDEIEQGNVRGLVDSSAETAFCHARGVRESRPPGSLDVLQSLMVLERDYAKDICQQVQAREQSA